MSLHIKREKLVLEVALVQRLHHVHNNHTGVEGTFDLKSESVIQSFAYAGRASYVEIHPQMLTA
jgi:hypothetical protein